VRRASGHYRLHILLCLTDDLFRRDQPQPAQLFLQRHRVRAGAGGFAADIKDVGPFFDQAQPLAERFIRLFAPAEVVVGVSGSCVAMVRHGYGELDLSGSVQRDWEALRGRVYEFTEFLVDVLGVTDLGVRFSHRVAIHNSCHALRELGISRQPRALLQAVEGLELVEVPGVDECCGFGGVFSAKYPALSNRIADRRASRLAEAAPEYVAGVDDACLQNLKEAFRRRGHTVQTLHVARILERNYEL